MIKMMVGCYDLFNVYNNLMILVGVVIDLWLLLWNDVFDEGWYGLYLVVYGCSGGVVFECLVFLLDFLV